MALHLVVTDSGVGGLSVCAALERRLREGGVPARLTYFNAWPSEGSGYNDMPDIASRGRAFERALDAMRRLRPARIVIACNTLSIVYEREITPGVTSRVVGIVDAGVKLFHEALASSPGSAIALFGTKTTIESGIHREKLLAAGIASERIVPVACHGLAKAIETGASGETTASLIEECASRAVDMWRRTSEPRHKQIAIGICCTHYTYVADQLRTAVERHCGQPVVVLDPNDSLVEHVIGELGQLTTSPGPADVTVRVISKVPMEQGVRKAMADRVQALSRATADALMSYTHVPDLF